MMDRVYSKGCKCKKKCEVDVIARVGNKPICYHDPHECGRCKRRFPDRLGGTIGGDYICGKKDCLDVEQKRIIKMLKNNPFWRRWSAR